MLVGPIFVREAIVAPRRVRHYIARAAYAGGLFILVGTAWQVMVGFQRVDSAGDVARFGIELFQVLSVLQLLLALSFAPIVAGASISAEKDRRTFDLLLMTDLTNWEIVVGKLFGSLLQMMVLLASAIPLFSLCLLLGGASFNQVARVFVVTAAAALASGSFGILMATWREKTFQTVALTILIIVLYFITVIGLFGARGWPGVLQGAELLGLGEEQWRAIVNPFVSLGAVLTQPAPATGSSILLGRVEWVFVAVMLVLTVVLMGAALVMLRVWNPSGGQPTHAREAVVEIERRMAAEAMAQPARQSRPIWDNPVLWREIRTRAYGRKPIVVKIAYLLVFATICLLFYFATAHNSNIPRLYFGLAVAATVVVSLFLVNLQAVTSITTERDGRALDLLLVTDISPKEFIFGKIWGVLYNMKEMVVLPIGFCIYLLSSGYVGWEVWLYLVIGILILVTFAITLGLHSSLAYEQTRAAILTSLGTIALLFIGVIFCIYLIIQSSQFESQAASFVVFICAGAVGMYAVLAVRNRSAALALVAFLCPTLTFYAIAHFLKSEPGNIRGGDPAGSFLAIALAYGFAVLAMLVPAVSEFDVATGRTVATEG